MISRDIAHNKSEYNFVRIYEKQINFISNKIGSSVDKGMRSVWIKKSEGDWASGDIMQTQRLIDHILENNFKVDIVEVRCGSMTTWTKDCDGIMVYW